MSRIRRTPAELIRTLSIERTQQEIAALLGISERTVRRYKRGDTSPSDKTILKRLHTAGSKEVKKLVRKGYIPDRVPVLIPWERKKIISIDQVTGRKKHVLSDWINYLVDGFSWQDMFDLIKRYVKKGIGWYCQIRGIRSPGTDLNDWTGTEITDLWPQWGGMTDMQIVAFINSFLWVEYSGDEEDDSRDIPNRPMKIGFNYLGV